jgi:hypothetical protein
VDEETGDDGERHQVGDEEHDAEPGEPPDRRQVRGRPRQQLAGLPLVVEPGLQALQVRVEVVAHGQLHAGDRAGLDPPPEEVQHRLGGAERGRGQAEQHQQFPVVMGDRPVDDVLRQQRDKDLGPHRQAGRHQHEDEPPQVGPQIAAGTPKCRQRKVRRGSMTVGGNVLGGHYQNANRGFA